MTLTNIHKYIYNVHNSEAQMPQIWGMGGQQVANGQYMLIPSKYKGTEVQFVEIASLQRSGE